MIDLEVTIVRRHQLALALTDADIEKVVVQALNAESKNGNWTISAVFVDDPELQDLHAQFMQIDEPTDVMTFPLDNEPGDIQGGDIVISVDRASEQGPENGLTFDEEVMFLLVHGVLHLCGWEDGTSELRKRMLARQRDILATFDRSGRSS